MINRILPFLLVIICMLSPDWVTATGKNIARTTFLINDPSGGVVTTLAAKYNNTYSGIRQFIGPEFTYTDKSAIWITFHSPGELLLTDPQGRRVGYDPIRNVSYNEIPNGRYEQTGLADNTDPTVDPGYTKEITISQPIEGEYILSVIGTGSGNYTLGIMAIDVNSRTTSSLSCDNVPIVPGIVHKYNFSFLKAAGSKTNFFGGFDGGGQRPRDVNKFLSYANPSESQTTLPAGTTTFPLHIFYGKTIIPGTFKAELNGVDISSAFNPVQGGDQVVMLNITSGRNVLVLSVNGQLPTRIATDTDRLVFKVQ